MEELYHGYRGLGNGVYPDNNEAGPAIVCACEIDSGLVVRNIEALNAGGSDFQRCGAGAAKGHRHGHCKDGECGELHEAKFW